MWIGTFRFLIVIFIHLVKDRGIDSGGANEWTYHGHLGPLEWYREYPHCGGRWQSPIYINKCDVEYDRKLTQFRFYGYDDVTAVKTYLANNGHTVEVDLGGRPIALSGGGLHGIYKVKQFHFHWGANDKRGSEHELNDYHFPMEMHIVHYAVKYGTFEKAEEYPDGLAVLAFFFQVGRHNPFFEPIVSHLDEIQFKGDNVTLRSFPLFMILPSNLVNYYRYQGSLTTPPCYECVIWTIFKTPEEISEEQLTRFRRFANANYPNQTNEKISDDYRPIQPLNGRRISSSDPSDARVPGKSTSPKKYYLTLRQYYIMPHRKMSFPKPNNIIGRL